MLIFKGTKMGLKININKKKYLLFALKLLYDFPLIYRNHCFNNSINIIQIMGNFVLSNFNYFWGYFCNIYSAHTKYPQNGLKSKKKCLNTKYLCFHSIWPDIYQYINIFGLNYVFPFFATFWNLEPMCAVWAATDPPSIYIFSPLNVSGLSPLSLVW